MNRLRRFFDRNGKRLMSAMLTLMLCISMLGIGITAKADDEPLDTTFYTMSSAAAGWLSDFFAEHGFGPDTTGGNAGGLLGYCDEADTSGVIVDLIQSAVSTSSSSYSYESLKRMGTHANGNGHNNFINYGNYGRVLKNLGLDNTANLSEKPLRKIIGGLMLMMFNVSTFINHIFEGMIDFLKAINPFRLFKVNGSDLINISSGAKGPFDGIETIDISGGNNLSDYISNLFVFLRDNFAWVIIIPGALGILIFSLFLTKKDKGYEVKKFIWRIAMIAFVTPVVGSLYTSSLEFLGDTISPANGTPAVKIIGSLFVDFQGWVEADNISIAGTGIVIDGLSSGNNAAVQMDANISSLRNVALLINDKASGGALNGAAVGDSSDVSSWNSNVNSSSGSDVTADAAVYVRDMIERYMNSDFYGPGDYQSFKKASWGAFKGTVYEDMVDGSNELLDWTEGGACGYLKSGGMGLWDSGAEYPWLGMSDMSMYNYLSSSFNNSGIEVYSNEKAASAYVRKMHYSVNMVGTGLTTCIMYVNAIVMLGCLIILAISYACGLMVASVKRTFRVITSMPLATLGSLRFGAKLIGNTVMMLAEVVATLFMYSIGVSLMYGVMNVIDGFFATIVSNLPIAQVATTAATVEYIMSTIMYVWLAIMLLRYRKKAVKAVDEAVADVINRLVPGAKSSDMIDPQKPSLASRALGAGGAAAGAAAAGYAMNKMAGAGDAAKGNASGETSATADGGDGGGGNGGDGGDGGDVNINNDSEVAVSDDDTVNADMDAGGDGFDNDDDGEGRAAIGASDLDEAGNGIEEGDNNVDVDNLDNDDNSEDVDNMTEDAGEDVGEGEAGGYAAQAGSEAGVPGGASAPKGNAAEGQKAVKSAQADLAKSEAEKTNLKKALVQSGGQTGTGGKGGKGQSMSDTQAQNGYKAAMNGELKAPAASDEKPGIGAKAAQQKKGAPLTAAERQAAENAAQAIKDRSAAPVKGVAPLTNAQKNAVSNAAMKAAQAANGGKALSAEQKREVAAAANTMAMKANAAANLSNTNQEAARMAAVAANGCEELSANDKQMVSQAASQVQAAAQRATSPEGLAQAAALQAAQAANGGRPLTSSQYQSVKQTAAQSASQVQSAAMAAAEAAKGAPLTAAEVSAVRQQCGVQAAQQAAVNAVEQCMEQPLSDGQRASLMEAAKGHAGSILADNSQVRQAEQSAAAAAKAMQTAHRLGRMSSSQYAQMMGNVRQATQQTIANAQPVNMASRAAVNAANQMRASRGQGPMSAAQTSQVVQNVAGSPEVQAQQAAVMRQQAYSNDAQAAARQMMDMYGGGSDGAQMSDGSYSAQAASIREQVSANYAEIESMRAQLAARGYSQQQISAIARNENAAARGETQNAQAADGPMIDVKQAAASGAARQAMNDHQQVKPSEAQQRAEMDAKGAAKQPRPKRTLGSSSAGDLLE